LKATGYWWVAGLTLCGLGFAAPPAGTPAAGPPAAGQGQSRTGAPVSREGEPNDDFIEFLGADDVGDAAWWEFLNKSAPHKPKPPAPPPSQDSKS
jgi:hypothetical protein